MSFGNAANIACGKLIPTPIASSTVVPAASDAVCAYNNADARKAKLHGVARTAIMNPMPADFQWPAFCAPTWVSKFASLFGTSTLNRPNKLAASATTMPDMRMTATGYWNISLRLNPRLIVSCRIRFTAAMQTKKSIMPAANAMPIVTNRRFESPAICTIERIRIGITGSTHGMIFSRRPAKSAIHRADPNDVSSGAGAGLGRCDAWSCSTVIAEASSAATVFHSGFATADCAIATRAVALTGSPS